MVEQSGDVPSTGAVGTGRLLGGCGGSTQALYQALKELEHLAFLYRRSPRTNRCQETTRSLHAGSKDGAKEGPQGPLLEETMGPEDGLAVDCQDPRRARAEV